MEVPHPALSDTDGSSSMGTGESVFFAHCLSSAHFGSTGKEGEAAPPHQRRCFVSRFMKKLLKN